MRNWLRSPRDSFRRFADEARHRAGLDPVIELRPGWRLRGHPAAWRVAFRLYLDDPAQVAELDAFLDTCRPGMQLFDLGAHYGLFSLAAARAGGTSVAVDPSAHALAMTVVGARLNGLADRIRPVHAAAAAAPGSMEMVDTGVQARGYFVQPTPDHGPRERTRVDTVSVDSLADAGGAPTHLKVDVEGFEEDALRGAERTLAGRAPPIVFLELHVRLMRENGSDPAAPLDRLAAHGYRFTWCDGRPATRGELLAKDLVRLVALPAASVTSSQWPLQGSNLGPSDYESGALTN
jgi:FkbM family methyltransferase